MIDAFFLIKEKSSIWRFFSDLFPPCKNRVSEWTAVTDNEKRMSRERRVYRLTLPEIGHKINLFCIFSNKWKCLIQFKKKTQKHADCSKPSMYFMKKVGQKSIWNLIEARQKNKQRNRATKLLELSGYGLRGMTRRNTKITSGKNWMRFLLDERG